MSFLRFFIARILTVLIVLSAVILMTISLLGTSMDDILKTSIKQDVVLAVTQDTKLSSNFKNLQDRQHYIDNQIKGTIHAEGLDEPWYSPRSMVTKFLKTMTLDLGRARFLTSDSGSQQVSNIILEKLPKTILLFSTSTIIITFIGLYLGAFSANRIGSLVDRFTSAAAIFSSSAPVFVVGVFMILLFAYFYQVLPARATPLTPPTDPYYILDLLYHMILPLATIILTGFGGWAYITRSLVINILNEDFIAVKRSQGIAEKKIIYSHALKNAAPPVIITVALSLSASLSGALIFETIFNWPGMGLLYFNAINLRDTPVILGQTYVLVLIFLITNFIVDMIYGLIDPRVKLV